MNIGEAIQFDVDAFELSHLPGVAAVLAQRITATNLNGDPRARQVLALAEEAGEFVGAARRYMGMARRPGPWEDMAAELADVVITAFVTAAEFDVNLAAEVRGKLEIIFTRPLKDW